MYYRIVIMSAILLIKNAKCYFDTSSRMRSTRDKHNYFCHVGCTVIVYM